MDVNAQNVEALAGKKADENSEFRMYLKSQDRLSEEEVDQKVFEIARRVWLKVDCLRCANCCKETGTFVTQAEAQRLATRLGLPVEEFQRKYLAVAEEADSTDDGEPLPWQIRGQPCPFLSPDNRCSVYEDRPAECRGYPYLDSPDFTSRTICMIERTFTCPAVYMVMEELKREFPHRRKQRGRW
jgi:uncharacterized protein